LLRGKISQLISTSGLFITLTTWELSPIFFWNFLFFAHSVNWDLNLVTLFNIIISRPSSIILSLELWFLKFHCGYFIITLYYLARRVYKTKCHSTMLAE